MSIRATDYVNLAASKTLVVSILALIGLAARARTVQLIRRRD